MVKRTAYEVLAESDPEDIKAYAEITIVVDGAVADEYYLAEPQDDELLGEIIEELRTEAESSGLPIEVYELGHAHGLIEGDIECVCSQYVQDHKPRWSWNV